MRTILFLTEKEANQYAEDNHLEETRRYVEFDNHWSSNHEYYDREKFFRVVGPWSGELSATVYTDGNEEIALGYWYWNGIGPTLTIDGEVIEDTELLGGVCATNGQPAEIDEDVVQDICIACKLDEIRVYTSKDGEDFEDMAAKLDFGEVLPRRILAAGDYIFCLPKDNPYFDRK